MPEKFFASSFGLRGCLSSYRIKFNCVLKSAIVRKFCNSYSPRWQKRSTKQAREYSILSYIAARKLFRSTHTHTQRGKIIIIISLYPSTKAIRTNLPPPLLSSFMRLLFPLILLYCVVHYIFLFASLLRFGISLNPFTFRIFFVRRSLAHTPSISTLFHVYCVNRFL